MSRHPSSVTAVAARLRTASARRPALARATIVAVCTFVGLRVWVAHRDADAARRSWGDTRTVWLTADDVVRGAQITARSGSYPVALVPPDAITTLPTGARAAHDIATGRLLVEGDLFGDTSAPPGWVELAVQREAAPLVVEGDPVTLLEPGRALCSGVVTGTGEVVSIAVPQACAASAVAALVDRTVVVARAVGDD